MGNKKTFINFCEEQIAPFVLNEEEKDLYNNFDEFLKGTNKGFDVEKGIFLRGVVGTGKTILFKMGQRYSETALRYKMVNAENIVVDYESKNSIEKYFKSEWCFDDIGTEDKANNYGKSVELFKRLIESRYELFKYHGVRTHFTSNVSNEVILDRYGERAFDRLKEMCSMVKYPLNESKRGTSKVRVLSSLIETVKTEEEKEMEEKEIIRKNHESIKNMIVYGFTSCLEGKPRKSVKIHTSCVDFVKKKRLFDIGSSMWSDLLDKSLNDFIAGFDDPREANRRAKNHDCVPVAKIMYLWLQFQKWKEEGLMDSDTLRSLLDN